MYRTGEDVPLLQHSGGIWQHACAPPLWRMTYAKSLLRCFLMSSFQNVEIMYFIEKKVQYLLQRQQKNIINSRKTARLREKGIEVVHRRSRAMCGS